MALQEKLDALKTEFEKKTAPEKLAVMHRATEELQRSGIVELVIKVGQAAPEFVLRNVHGTEVSSSELLRRGPLVVTFYRGVW